MTETVLSVKRVSKKFGRRSVVEDISFQVEAGQTLGLLGPNGAGKSTLVNLICGLLKPDAGEVWVLNEHMTGANQTAKKQLGLVPQELALFDELSARNNLKLFGALYGLAGQQLQKRCDEVLELVKLTDRAKDQCQTFSGGMKRRLNIAAALMHDPQLLILDEPTVGIDPQSRNAIFDSLEELKSQGRALIYTSHHMEEVERLADRIVILDRGKIIADQTPNELIQRLPAKAALHLNLLNALPPPVFSQLKQQVGVSEIRLLDGGKSLEIALSQQDDALAILNFLSVNDCAATHFATAKTNLEDVFLTLTGRSLRDSI